ncbi:MAG: hypothetical protein ACO1N0_17165 [Fluviicola sp.]
MNKTLESLKSKKFDSKNLVRVTGGETTYGPARETRYDGFGGQNGDTAAMTYNPANKPAGSQGLDYITS